MLYIGQKADGSYTWEAIIIAHYRFDLSGRESEPTEEELLNNFQGVLESTIIERD